MCKGGGGGGESLVELDYSLVARVVLASCDSGTVFVTFFLTAVETLSTRCHNAHPNVLSVFIFIFMLLLLFVVVVFLCVCGGGVGYRDPPPLPPVPNQP